MSEESLLTNEESQLDKERSLFERLAPYLGALVSFALAFGFAFTPLWQLSLLAGVVGGLFFKEMKKGLLAGLASVGLAWALYVIIQVAVSQVEVLIDQIGGIILGSLGFGWLFILIIILVGGIFGALGGCLGSGVRVLVDSRKPTSS